MNTDGGIKGYSNPLPAGDLAVCLRVRARKRRFDPRGNARIWLAHDLEQQFDDAKAGAWLIH